jgi:hypothetical protein
MPVGHLGDKRPGDLRRPPPRPQVTPDSTEECLTMFNQLLATKMAGHTCDLQVDNGVITMAYAW